LVLLSHSDDRVLLTSQARLLLPAVPGGAAHPLGAAGPDEPGSLPHLGSPIKLRGRLQSSGLAVGVWLVAGSV